MNLLSRASSRRLCAALHQSALGTLYSTVCAHSTASHAAVPVASRPLHGEWERTLTDFYNALGTVSGVHASVASRTGSARDLRAVCDKAVEAMRCCLESGRFQEAVDVHTAACRCGLSSVQLSTGGPSPVQGDAALLDTLALAAVRQLPFCVQQSRTMLSLLDAEDDSFRPSTHPLSDSHDVPAVELFRVGLQQRLHVLRTTGQLQRSLGHQYLLSAMREVGDSESLRTEVETLPLVQLSSLALWHPFAYESPTCAWARRQKLFDTVGTHGAGVNRYTVTQERQLQQLSDATASIRPLCTSSVSLLSALVPSWDALFLRRVAETLVLPEAAHDVFPSVYTHARRTSRRRHRRWTGTELPAAAWLDGSLFRDEDSTTSTGSPTGQYHPLQRLDAILKRRSHLDIVVPDPDFLFRNFQQLLQLARHREIVVTHGVMLDIVDLACAPEDPRRFRARRVLLNLLHVTAPPASDVEDCPTPPAPCAVLDGRVRRRDQQGRHTAGTRRRRQPSCGFTLLGLQDELALLERCPERFFLGDRRHRHCDSVNFNTQCLQLPGSPSRCRRSAGETGMLSALLVAKQLQRVVASFNHSIDVYRGTVTAGSNADPSLDDIVKGILENPANDSARTPELAPPPQPAPLFKQRSRLQRVRTPVVVATTSPTARTEAFSIGVEMYPPVVVQ